MKAGYVGKDSMRAKAEKMLGVPTTKELTSPASFSAPSNTKMRYYKKGGHVEKHEEKFEKRPTQKDQGSMMKQIKPAMYKKGGKVTGLKAPLNIESMKDAKKLKRGGKAK